LHIHLDQRLLHPLHERAGALDQGGAMAQIGAECDDAIGGAKATTEQAQDVQIAKPLAIGHIALAAGEILHMAGIDEDDLKAARVEDLEHGNPIDAGGFHRDVRDAAARQPLGQPLQITGERGKGTHRCGVTIGWDGDEMFGGPTIDPRRIGMEAFQGRWRRSRLR
jgi:hypothetical protein